MKLLLTSAGLTNESIRQAFRDLVGNKGRVRVAFIPTAANREMDTAWLEQDKRAFLDAGAASVDVVDIETLPKEEWLSRLRASQAICFGGGNTYHLLNQVRASGLDVELAPLLKDRLYVGISAGSCIAGPSIALTGPLYPEDEVLPTVSDAGLGLVPFVIAPHVGSPFFSKATLSGIAAFAAGQPYPVYALDDDCAAISEDSEIRFARDGVHEIFEGK